jgi:cytoskeletal protein CcmA (bactofilin family)
MSFFGAQARQDLDTTPRAEEAEPVEELDELPVAPKRRTDTVIAQGVTLTGSLQGQGVVDVEGTVDGELNIDGAVCVTAAGLITGPVTADVIRISGRVVGPVNAREHLRLERSGSIEGDVNAASLVVEDGGRLNGRATMTQAPAKSTPSATNPPLGDLQFGPQFKLGEDDKLASESAGLAQSD